MTWGKAYDINSVMKDQQLNIRVTEKLLKASWKEADRRGLTLSDWLRGLMAEATGGPLLPSTKQRPSRAKTARR